MRGSSDLSWSRPSLFDRYLPKKVRDFFVIVFVGIVAGYVLVYADLFLRARSACLEGEKYMEWHRNPLLKKAFFDARFEAEKNRLDADRAAGRMAEPEYRQKFFLAEVERNDAVAESSLKYAFHWYQTAAELFSPPESRWVRLSRQRMAEAKRLWKTELDAAGIPYKEYMLE